MGGQHDSERARRDEGRVDGDRMSVERNVAALAARQHLATHRDQLTDCGLTASQVDNRLKSGRLHLLHRGVYLVGPPAPREWTYEMAAVIACGPCTFVANLSAAWLWGLLPHPADPRPVHVAVPGRNPGRKAGIRIRRVACLDRSETRIRLSIPVTSPRRTLLDLAATRRDDLEVALAEAYAKRITTRSEVLSLAAKHPRHRGAKRLRALTEGDRAPARLRSEAERRLLGLLRRARLSQPEVNVRFGPYVLDFLWRPRRLVIEVDGFRWPAGHPEGDGGRRRPRRARDHVPAGARHARRLLGPSRRAQGARRQSSGLTFP